MEENSSSSQNYDKQKYSYKRITAVKKKQLISKIIVEKQSLSHASKILKMNLSTAKSIIRRYKLRQEKIALNQKTSSSLEIEKQQNQQLEEKQKNKISANQDKQADPSEKDIKEVKGSIKEELPVKIGEKELKPFGMQVQAMNVCDGNSISSYFYPSFAPLYHPGAMMSQFDTWRLMYSGWNRQI